MAAMLGAIIVSTSVCLGAGGPTSYSDLHNLTSGVEDARMNAQDLALLLVTHDFDAWPKEDSVLVKLNGTVYKLTPNEDQQGLAEITPMK